jgi:hypothetical protein
MSTSGTVGGLDARLSEYIGVTSDMVPCVRIVHAEGGDVKKFNLEGDLTAANMVAMFNDFEAGNLVQHVKSEEVPET